MKSIFLYISIFFLSGLLLSQNKKLYNPNENAQQKIDSAVHIAKQDHKFVFLQIGGNWCIWCSRFDKFVNENEEIKNLLDDNFIVYHLNYSKENKNIALLKKLDFPQRFGFPVFVILNEKGERIHTQQTDLLEENNSYNIKKVYNFINQWTPKSLDPENYDTL